MMPSLTKLIEVTAINCTLIIFLQLLLLETPRLVIPIKTTLMVSPLVKRWDSIPITNMFFTITGSLLSRRKQLKTQSTSASLDLKLSLVPMALARP